MTVTFVMAIASFRWCPTRDSSCIGRVVATFTQAARQRQWMIIKIMKQSVAGLEEALLATIVLAISPLR